MNYWIIADTHFGHEILRSLSNRPTDADLRIFKGLRCIGHNDILIHLGDVCIGNDSTWHDKFRNAITAKMVLVRGNHDKRSIKWYIEHGWDSVVDRFDLHIFGQRVAFSHIPLPDDGSFSVNVHGHFHNSDHHRWEPDFKDRMNEKHKLIYLEHQYRPISLRSIIAC